MENILRHPLEYQVRHLGIGLRGPQVVTSSEDSGGVWHEREWAKCGGTQLPLCFLSWQPHLIHCFANLLMVVQRNDRTKENLCKMDQSGQGMETW